MTSPRRRSGRRAPNISTLCAQHPVTHGTGVYLAGSPERLLPSDGLRSSGIGPRSSLWDPHLSARFLGSTSLFLSATTSQQTRLPRALLPLHTPGHRPFPAASPTLAASHSAPPSHWCCCCLPARPPTAKPGSFSCCPCGALMGSWSSFALLSSWLVSFHIHFHGIAVDLPPLTQLFLSKAFPGPCGASRTPSSHEIPLSFRELSVFLFCLIFFLCLFKKYSSLILPPAAFP